MTRYSSNDILDAVPAIGHLPYENSGLVGQGEGSRIIGVHQDHFAICYLASQYSRVLQGLCG
jgi:hypothetical protein